MLERHSLFSSSADQGSRPGVRQRADGGRIPPWLKRTLSVHGQWAQAKELVEELKLHTVCEEARCPNLGECWSHGNVSFMVLGSECTRRCAFCAVKTGRPSPIDEDEPRRLAEAVFRLGLTYVVVTSVARDDLKDEGAGHFSECIWKIKTRSPGVQVEVLTPDLHARRELIGTITRADPDVYNHNLETVSRLSREVRPQADYRRSLEVLRLAKEMARSGMKTKSGLMVGLGETPHEIRTTMEDLRRVGCDILTVGQYLQPTFQHKPVAEFVKPEMFKVYHAWGEELGFSFVASAPYVRSSYNAFEALGG